MKNLKIKIVFMIIMSVLTLATMCATITLAWFTTTARDNYKMTIKANSMLVLKFDSGINVTPEAGKLHPAVEKKNAIAENMVFPKDLTEMHETLTSTANEIEYKTTLDVYLESFEDSEGNLVFTPQNVTFGLSLTIVTSKGETFEIYNLSEINDVVNFKFYMQSATIDTDPNSENSVFPPDTPDYVEVRLSEPYRYDIDKEISLKLFVSLSKPAGLLDPELRDAELTFNINVRASDV